jgi:hypothetical protein
MKQLLFCLFFPVIQVTFAQTDFTRVYYPIINDAELAIVDDDHETALSFYKEAFNLVEKPFAKDYYNAAICAVYTNRMNLAFDYLSHLFVKGYHIDSLRKDIFFKKVADTCKQWNEFEKKGRLIKPQINVALRDSLMKLEKEMSTFVQDKNRINTTQNLTINRQDTLVKIVSNSIIISGEKRNFILQQIENEGFPDENEIGLMDYYYEKNDSDKKKRVFYVESYLPYDNMISSIIFRISSLSLMKIPASTILKGVREGKILPYQAQRLIADEPKYNSLLQQNIHAFQVRVDNDNKCESDLLKNKLNKWFLKKDKVADMSEIELNEMRTNWGLAKIEDNFRKILFKASFPTTPFILHCGGYHQEISFVSTCEAAEKVILESEELR